ncbi:MAG TPA: ribonuclease III [Thermodesulfobacteriota bacterium]
MKDAYSLEGFMGSLPFEFTDSALMKKVFVHRSFLNEREGAGLKSNERLEFLGDAILSNIISHMLFRKFPDIHEGELTRMRAKLVNRLSLACLAKEVSLDKYLLLGKGERLSGGTENPTILAGVFEALIAAVYFNQGFQKTFDYVERLFSPLLADAIEGPGHFDFKPRLQELSQKLFKETPSYILIGEKGPPHRKIFEIEVQVAGKTLGSGRAPRKKDAEQAAAGEALENLTERFAEFFPEAATVAELHGA